MATSPPKWPEEGRKKRQITSYAGESSLQPARIAKSEGGNGTHSHEPIIYLLGLRLNGVVVDAPEVDGPQPTRHVSDCDPDLIATKLSNRYRRLNPNDVTLLIGFASSFLLINPRLDLRD